MPSISFDIDCDTMLYNRFYFMDWSNSHSCTHRQTDRQIHSLKLPYTGVTHLSYFCLPFVNFPHMSVYVHNYTCHIQWFYCSSHVAPRVPLHLMCHRVLHTQMCTLHTLVDVNDEINLLVTFTLLLVKTRPASRSTYVHIIEYMLLSISIDAIALSDSSK